MANDNYSYSADAYADFWQGDPRNAERETPTVFYMGHPLHKCMFPGCSNAPHIASDTYECEFHTLDSLKREAQDNGVDDYLAAEIAKWEKRVI